MDFLILAAVVLAGSVLESAFAFLFAEKNSDAEMTFDSLTEARYSRLQDNADVTG